MLNNGYGWIYNDVVEYSDAKFYLIQILHVPPSSVAKLTSDKKHNIKPQFRKFVSSFSIV